MKVSIGSPNVVKGADAQLLMEWASRVDAGPFSSLGTMDIVSSYGYEPLTVLAAAAAVTQRVRLMTNIMLGPVRNSLILAKQALSIDAISGGRLTLGLGVGSREGDYWGSPVPFRQRGRGFEEQLILIKRLWAGEPARDGGGPVGPPPAQSRGPELLVGGYSSQALDRAGRLADGYIASGASAEQALATFTRSKEAWTAAGRTGEFRFVAMQSFALGPSAQKGGEAHIRSFYGASVAMQMVLDTFLRTPAQVQDALRAFSDVGVDEFVLSPAIAELDQIDRLADLIG
jgi:alkanesulfonate monooxygenase SsuD/methylene tetrahydromethanopterin reductase-like flavin-dependent oxidoreductase (luciferase family)